MCVSLWCSYYVSTCVWHVFLINWWWWWCFDNPGYGPGHTSQSNQTTKRVSFIDCLFVSHSVRWCRSWPRCFAGQRTIHAKTRVSTIWDACVRYGTVSVETSWRRSSCHWSSHVSTIYCNSVFSGLPASSLAPLQRVQNAAAGLVLNLDRQSHITSALQQLHWLPVKFRIIFKTATLVHQILHNNRCPSYLTNLVEFNTADSQRRQLRSSLTRAAVVKRTRTHFGKRAFSVCGPHTWKSSSSGPQHWQLPSVQTSSQVTSVSSCF